MRHREEPTTKDGPIICGGCDKQIFLVHDGAVVWSTHDGDWGECGDNRERHFPKTFSDEELVPKGHRHPGEAPVAPDVVLSGYANLVRGIQRANQLLPERERFHVPFGVQEVIAAYVEKDAAIRSIKED